MSVQYSPVYFPYERRKAHEDYKQKFNKPYPSYYVHAVYGDDWEAEVSDIERRIKENDPAPDKPLPDGVVY